MAGAVVTGLGIASPNGLGTADYWAATRAGRSGIGPVTHFDPAQYPVRLAGEVKNFDATGHLSSRLLTQTDRMTQMALVAADWALADAGLKPGDLPPAEMGVITASASGGFQFGQSQLQNLWSQGGRYVSAYQSFAWFYAVNSGQISIRHNMRGASGVVVSEQAGGLDALAQSRRQLRGGMRLIISGAMDASICAWGWVAQMSSGRLSSGVEPDRAYLPFDENAAGHVPGEGGAILVVEDAESAAIRGAASYGELAGFASTLDPRTGDRDGSALRRAIDDAIIDAGVHPAEIDVVFADAAAVPCLDRAEAAAITAVFGAGGVPVVVPKTMTGRLYSGAAALDVATALLAIRDGVLPAAVNVRPAPQYDLDLVVDQPRHVPVRTALVVARGYGGFNSVAVVRGPSERRVHQEAVA